jgi:hypothetical protein
VGQNPHAGLCASGRSMTKTPLPPLIKPFEAPRPRTVTVRIVPELLPAMMRGDMRLSFNLPLLVPGGGQNWSEVLFTPAIEQAIARGELEELRPPVPSGKYALASDEAPKRKRKGGNRPGKIWEELIFPCLAAKVARNGPFADMDAAIFAARECLRDDPKKRTLDATNVARTLKRWCRPEWLRNSAK